jgi:hypothetical protein
MGAAEMKKLWIFAALAVQSAYGQTATISDTITSAVGGGSWSGRVIVTLNSPSLAQPLYSGTTSLAGWQAVYCVGVTGSDCTTATAAGVFAATLYTNDAITPTGTSYAARFLPTRGAAWLEAWVVAAGNTKLYQIRATTVPTPTVTFQESQLALTAGSLIYGNSSGVGAELAAGTNGHVLTLSSGYPAWAAPGNATTATALAANGANCSAGQFPLGVDASGASESCTALPTTITGTANQITASASTGPVTLSLPTTITGLSSVTSTAFVGALIGNASTATALQTARTISGTSFDGSANISIASTGLSDTADIVRGAAALTTAGAIPYVTSSGTLAMDTPGMHWDATNNRLGIGTASPSNVIDVYTNATVLPYPISIRTPSNGSYFAFTTNDGSGSYIDSSAISLSIRTLNSGGAISFSPNATEAARFVAAGNLIIGGTTDGNYKLDVAKSGSTGTTRFYDQTATTGSTLVAVRAGAGQSGPVVVYQSSAGATVSRVDQTGANYGPYFIDISATPKFALNSDSGKGLQLGSGHLVQFSSTTAYSGTADTGLARDAAGVLEANNGTAGTYRDILARVLRTSPTTVGALQTCNSTNKGGLQSVTDSLAPAWGVTVAAGGSAYALVTCNGTNWTVVGI